MFLITLVIAITMFIMVEMGNAELWNELIQKGGSGSVCEMVKVFERTKEENDVIKDCEC